jgi:hypothetical protein
MLIDPLDDPECEDYVVALANASLRSPLRRGSCWSRRSMWGSSRLCGILTAISLRKSSIACCIDAYLRIARVCHSRRHPPRSSCSNHRQIRGLGGVQAGLAQPKPQPDQHVGWINGPGRHDPMVEDEPELWHACMASRGFAVDLQPAVNHALLWRSDGPDRV